VKSSVKLSTLIAVANYYYHLELFMVEQNAIVDFTSFFAHIIFKLIKLSVLGLLIFGLLVLCYNFFV